MNPKLLSGYTESYMLPLNELRTQRDDLLNTCIAALNEISSMLDRYCFDVVGERPKSSIEKRLEETLKNCQTKGKIK